jgi:hypothetical protein
MIIREEEREKVFTRVSHGDFVDFIWIKPNLAFPTL